MYRNLIFQIVLISSTCEVNEARQNIDYEEGNLRPVQEVLINFF